MLIVLPKLAILPARARIQGQLKRKTGQLYVKPSFPNTNGACMYPYQRVSMKLRRVNDALGAAARYAERTGEKLPAKSEI